MNNQRRYLRLMWDLGLQFMTDGLHHYRKDNRDLEYIIHNFSSLSKMEHSTYL